MISNTIHLSISLMLLFLLLVSIITVSAIGPKPYNKVALVIVQILTWGWLLALIITNG